MTKKSITFDVLPMGLCGICLEAMIDPERGHPAVYKNLGGERALWSVYCEHNQCGAYAFIGPGHTTKWTLQTPVDVLEFLALVEKAAGFYLDAAAGGEPS